MHPGGVRSATHLFDFEKSANLKHPNVHLFFCIMFAYSLGRQLFHSFEIPMTVIIIRVIEFENKMLQNDKA